MKITLTTAIAATLIAAATITACSPIGNTTPTKTAPAARDEAARDTEFLRQLRAAGVQVSRTGAPEVNIGRAVCGQLETRSADDIAAELSRTVVVWSLEEGKTVVRVAQSVYC